MNQKPHRRTVREGELIKTKSDDYYVRNTVWSPLLYMIS